MVGQMIDMEALDLGIERKLQRYQQKFNMSDADIAWILLRLGTRYYFKDISSRGLNGNQPIIHHGYVANKQYH